MSDAITTRTGIVSSLFVLVVAAGAGVFFLRYSHSTGAMIEPTSVTLSGPAGERIVVEAEIADTPEERERGLMFRKQLDDGKGMLFSFTDYMRPTRLSFWMKNTLIPLDILFFDAQANLVSVAHMTPCAEEPCDLYRSEGPSVYALEVPAGFIDQHQIGPGWRLEMPSGH